MYDSLVQQVGLITMLIVVIIILTRWRKQNNEINKNKENPARIREEKR